MQAGAFAARMHRPVVPEDVQNILLYFGTSCSCQQVCMNASELECACMHFNTALNIFEIQIQIQKIDKKKASRNKRKKSVKKRNDLLIKTA